LYDLESDPGEKVNRGADPSLGHVRNQLNDRLRAWYDVDKNPYRPVSKV